MTYRSNPGAAGCDWSSPNQFAVAYVGAAGYLLFVFTAAGNTVAVLAAFASLGSFASAIVGFWFPNLQARPPLPSDRTDR